MAAPEQPLPMPRGCQGSAALSLPRGDRTLLVRHLPAELTAEEKEDLLKYFGAQSVRVLSDKGRLKHTAFATFPNEKAAIKALTRLHQLKLLGHTLVVEFAKEQDRVHSPCPSSGTEKKKRSEDPVEDEKEKKELGCLTIENEIAPNHGLTFPLNSCLKYMYPPPSSTILANIVNALASVPKFYVQVLHLMNKMNLPTPFGQITARPPMYEDYMPLHAPLPPASPQPPEEPPLPDEDEELSSKESEYESSDDEDRQRMTKLMELANLQPKRPKTVKQHRVRKKQKIKDMLNTPSASHSNLHPVLLPSDVFEQPQPVGNKKIEFHITTDMTTEFKKDTEKEQNCDLPASEADESNIGFGKIFPKPNLNITEETKEDSDEMPSECISRRELERGRISREEMETLSVFRSYEPGEPNCRIYVKNLAKHVQEKDLKFIFGRYVDFSSETQRIMFDIRLMKEGRMKGQAFIGLPNEKAAAKALKEANGYVLSGKPMVVQFARSARPKQDSKEGKRSVKNY
ncbi:RNA-binding region-containing protein 3 isoform X4 [Manis pentadactyla]|uniref:RNA-binding region-containing protein 3 isoform X4 n=1 Tax=Manis pentadactyla TaxID=143292 RepID=UPI0018769F81|nr:RNA-binding region-containing protein 3 isoform X4 [Manis pentadactyla]KAI5282716.1 Rna-Binding Region-Containing Protein 3 [Manis pentadactyla]